MNIKKIHFSFILLFFITAGLFLRFYNLRYNIQFTWDQDYFSFSAQDIIINHHFPLTGGRTSTGNIQVGPLYSYILSVFFMFFKMDPIAIAFSTGFFSLIIVISGYYLLKKTILPKGAIYFALLWSCLPFMVNMDRIPWNVNIFPIATIIICSGMWMLLDKSNLGWLITGFGIIIGINSQLSVVFFIFTAMLFFILKKDLRNKSVFYFLIILSIGILPLVIFNFRHQNLLLSNTSLFLQNSTIKFNNYLSNFVSVLLIYLQVIGLVIINDAPKWFQMFIGFSWLLLLAIYRKYNSISKYLYVFIPTSIFYLLGYSLYSGSLPEYYFSGIITLVVIGWSILTYQFISHFNFGKYIILIFLLVSIYRTMTYLSLVNPQSIGVKQDIVSQIKKQIGKSEFSVNYDMDFGLAYGFDYMFYYYGLGNQKTDNSKNMFWISYPKSRYPGLPDAIVSDTAIGYPQSSNKILLTKNVSFYDNLFKLRVPKEWIVAQCPSVDFDSYIISGNKKVSCDESGTIRIVNIPNCIISSLGTYSVTELKNGIKLLEFTNQKLNLDKIDNNSKIFITSLEKYRCIGFVINQNDKPSEARSILESIRVIAN